MTAGNLPSVDVLRQMFRYEPESGILYWLPRDGSHRAWNTKNAHKPAGSRTYKANGLPSGLSLRIGGRKCLVHRIAWALAYGEVPSLTVDHRNCNPFDNRLSNLRLATGDQQRANARLLTPTATGFKGVKPMRSKFQACITRHGKTKWLGTFKTAEEAHAAYCKAAVEVFGEFARTE